MQGDSPTGLARATLPWVGDFLRARDELELDTAASATVLRLLGFAVHEADAAAAPLSRSEPQRPPPAALMPPPPSRAAGLPATPADAVPSMRLYSQCDILPADPSTTSRPAWMDDENQHALDMSAPAWRLPAPLFGPLRRRSILTALLAHRVHDGAPDVAAIVRRLAGGQPLLRLPLQPRRTLAFGAEVLVDGADWLQPFHADAKALLPTLRALLPQGRLRVSAVRGGPDGVGPSAALPRSTVLALTDFGAGFRHLGQRPAPASAWLQLARRLAANDRRLRALVPLPARRWPALLRPQMPIVYWAESTTLGDVRRALRPRVGTPPVHEERVRETRQQAAFDLATVLAPARRIDSALLRQARRELLPGVAPEAEADLWFGPMVGSRGPAGITLRDDDAPALLARLAEGRPVARQRALGLLIQAQHDQPESVRIEEALQRLAQATTLDEAAIERVLRPAYKALAEGGSAARAAAAWVPQAWHRMPAALRNTAPVQRLALAAAVHGRAAGWMTGAVPAPDVGAIQWLMPSVALDAQDWSIEMREYEDGEVVVRLTQDAEPSHAVHRVRVPAQPALIGVVAQRDHPPTVRWAPLQPGLEIGFDESRGGENPTVMLLTLGGERIRLVPSLQGLLESVVLCGRNWFGVALADDLAVVVPVNRHVEAWPDEMVEFRQGLGDAPIRPGRLLGYIEVRLDDPSVARRFWVVRFPSGSLRPIDRMPMGAWGGRGGDHSTTVVWDQGSSRLAEPDRHAEIPWIEVPAGGAWRLVLPDRGTLDKGMPKSPPSVGVDELRDRALTLRAERWVVRIVAGKDARAQANAVSERLHETAVIDADNPVAPNTLIIIGAAPPSADAVVIVGPVPPNADDQALVLSGIPVLWAPMTSRARAALLDWPPALRDIVQQRQWITAALDDKADPAAVAREIAAWSPFAPDAKGPAPASPAAETTPPGFWSSLTMRARRSIVAAFENRLAVGLHRVPLDGECRLEPIESLGADREILLLIHGQGSDFAGTFGGLWAPGNATRLARLRQRFGHAVAFVYRSMSRGLFDNAADLAASLPYGARLHVVAHSGGGVLGELLCSVPGNSWPGMETIPATRRLSSVLREKNLRVDHLVRVAAPMRGMSMLERGMARMSTVSSVVGTVLPMFPSQLAEQLVLLFRDPHHSPGLADLMPDSDVIALFRDPAAPTLGADSRLTVIAGETRVAGLSAKLRQWSTRLLLPGDERNDGLVELAEHFGGFERARGFELFFDAGPDVTHFSYFTRENARQALIEALAGSSGGAMRHMVSYGQALELLGLVLYAEKRPDSIRG